MQVGPWQKILQSLINLGVYDGLPIKKQLLVRVANGYSLCILIICALYSMVFLWMGLHLLSLITLGAGLSYLLPIAFNQSRTDGLGRLSVVALGNALTVLFALVLGPKTGMHLFCFGNLVLGFLLFDADEKAMISFNFLLTSATFGLLFYGASHVHFENLIPLLPYEVISMIAAPASFLTVMAGLIAIRLRMRSYEDLLEGARNEAIQYSQKLKESEEHVVSVSRFAAIGELAAGVAHEINNPLNIIAGAAQCIKKSAADHSQLKDSDIIFMAKQIDHTVHRIAGIVDGLRTLSKSRPEMVKEPMVVYELMEDLINVSVERFRTEGVLLEIKGDFDAEVSGDRGQLAQVFLNLLNNAFDAVRDLKQDERWVKISGGVDQTTFRFAIKNGGPPIPIDHRLKIFEPFFTTKEVGTATGIGLSLSKTIIDEHGGRLMVDWNQPCPCFVVELPFFRQESLKIG